MGALLFIINHPTIEGPVNFTSPQPIRMSQLGRCINNHLRRPNWFSIPEPLLKIALGEMSLLITEGQYVTPTVLLENGYIFQYTDMKEAIRSLY